jgi:hypothetical protein
VLVSRSIPDAELIAAFRKEAITAAAEAFDESLS